ncbi:MAG: polysaccharide deacetylase family protein [Armatimonadota bacterium]
MNHRIIIRLIVVLVIALVCPLHPVYGLKTAAPTQTAQAQVSQNTLNAHSPFSSNQRYENYITNTAMPVSRVLQQMSVKKIDKKKPKLIFLTIDDGPSRVTPEVLDVLKKYNVKATFFVIGSQIKGNEAILRRAWAEGHAIANHSYRHKYSGPPDNFRAEFEKTDRLLTKALEPCTTRFCTGVIRIPGGSMGKPALKKAFAKGSYIGINWNVSGADTCKKCLPAESIASNVKQWANKRQCIVVLDHDSSPKKSLPAALGWIIPYYQAKGYQFGTLCSESSWQQAVAVGLIPRQPSHRIASKTRTSP